MAFIIAGELERFRQGEAPPALEPGVLEPYERRALTGRLAQIFDAVVDGHSATLPRAEVVA